MIKYLMRKTIYKEYDKESQDMLLQLDLKQHIVQILCIMFWGVIYIFPYIPLLIIEVRDGSKLSTTTQIVIIALMLLYFVGFIVFMIIFFEVIVAISLLLAERIYFLVCTTKGKAISRKEFKIIKNVNEELYLLLTMKQCRGHCFSICFAICQALKNGSIEFIAIKEISTENNKEKDEKNFTMHVIYVNNGWAFDTYSSRQYPIDKMYEINKAKIYKAFSFAEISNKSYEEFKKEQLPGIEKWCRDNDCSVSWKVRE